MKIINPEIIPDSETITRASIGSYFNSSGVLQTAAIDEFRITHEPYPQALFEVLSTNELTYSEDLSMWPGTAVIGTPDTSSGISLDLLTDNDSGSSMSKYRTYGANPGDYWHISLFLIQSGTDNKFYMSANFYNGSTPISYTYAVDFATKTVTSNSTEAYQLREINASTGLFRLELKITNNATGNNAFSIEIFPAYRTGVTDTGSVYVGGCQIEQLYWSSYIKTVATTISRSQDIAAGFYKSTIAEPDTGETIWNSATAYVVGNRCILTSTHKVYECLINNTNASPDVNLTGATPKWIIVGATNKYAMFDELLYTQTEIPGDTTLSFNLNTVDEPDSFSLHNCDMDEIIIVVKEALGSLYSKVVNMVGVSDYYDSLPTYLGLDNINLTKSSINLTIKASTSGKITTGKAAIGKIVFGKVEDIGMTQYGSTAGIIDYSIKNIDSFGNSSIIIRNFSKRNTIKLIINNTDVDRIFSFLASIRSIPVTWVGSDNIFSTLILYGYYRDFEIDISYPEQSYCSLTLEGLI